MVAFIEIQNYLVTYHRTNLCEATSLPDLGEKIGQWGVGWLSLGFGKSFKVTYSLTKDSAPSVVFEKEHHPTWQRVCAAVMAILLFPLSIILTGIGWIGLLNSKSFTQLSELQEEKLPSKSGHIFEEAKIVHKAPEKKIPPKCDVRETTWFDNFEHVFTYAKDYLKEYPQVCFLHSAQANDGITGIEWILEEGRPLPEAFVFCPLISDNHFVLVYICNRTHTIEYYDSKVNYGNYKSVIAELEEFAKRLPGPHSYKVVKKITQKLQPDSYQCGPWVLYFLKERVQNPHVDFNLLNIDKAQKMIAKFRIKIMNRLIEIVEQKQALNASTK